MKVYITYFKNDTEPDMMEMFQNQIYTLGSYEKINVTDQDIVILSNLDTRELLGVARIKQCIEPHPYDSLDIYKNKPKYNKFEIQLYPDSVFMFKKRVAFDTIREWIGGKKEYKTNIYKGFPSSWRNAFVKDENNQLEHNIMSRFYDWVQTYV